MSVIDFTEDHCDICEKIIGIKVYPTQKCECKHTICYKCFLKRLEEKDYKDIKCISCDYNYLMTPKFTIASKEELQVLDLKYPSPIKCPLGCRWIGSRIDFLGHKIHCVYRRIHCCQKIHIYKDHKIWCNECLEVKCSTNEYHKCLDINRKCEACKKQMNTHQVMYCRRCEEDYLQCLSTPLHSEYCDYPPKHDPYLDGMKRAKEELTSRKKQKTTDE
jgi:hypothetical protein